MSRVRSLIEKCRASKRRIAVWGDVMLDRWDTGNVSRICPEAPVPVLMCHASPPVFRLGGAGNVAEQLHAWGAIGSSVYGIVDESTIAASMFGHDWRTQRNTGSVRVPVKNRFVDADGRLLIRCDYEKPNYGLDGREIAIAREEVWRKLLDGIEAGRFHAVLVSDYAKGTLDAEHVEAVAKACHVAAIPCGINVHRSRPLAWYRSPTAVAVANDEYAMAHDVGATQMRVVVTRGASPPVVRSCGREHAERRWFVPPVRVRSVSGAGDAFVSSLTVALSHGFSIDDAAAIAHHAGRVYVQCEHNRVPHWRDIYRDESPIDAKVIDASELRGYLQQHIKTRVVVANGCFDLLHPGHIAFLRWARSQGDLLVVAVNSDESVRRLRGEGRPVISLEHRIQHLASLKCVDLVTSFDEDTPDDLLAGIARHTRGELILAKGHECTGQEIPGATHADRVMIAPDFGIPYHSTALAPHVDYGHDQIVY